MSTQSNSRGKGEVIAVEFRPAKGGATSETHVTVSGNDLLRVLAGESKVLEVEETVAA